MDQNELLIKFGFLKKLPMDELKHLLETVSYRNIQAGTVLINEHMSCPGVTFVLAGEIKVYKVSESGREITLYSVKGGETCVLTVSCLLGLNNMVSPVSAIAVQDSRVAVIPADVFTYIYTTSPFFQQFIFKNILDKFYDVIDLVEHLTFKSVTERLIEYITLNTADGEKPLYSTHAQLAARLGSSREVITRRLNDLEGAGKIKTERGKIVLLKQN